MAVLHFFPLNSSLYILFSMLISYSTHIKYAVRFRSTSVWGGFVSKIQFYQNRILTMEYCSVKDCISTSSYKNVILHTIKEQWIAIVKWKTDSPNRICSRYFKNKCYRSLYGKSCGTMLYPYIWLFLQIFMSK